VPQLIVDKGLSGSVHKGLARSGWLVAIGLMMQMGFSWLEHPLAFVGFLLLSCPLVLAGTLLFFWTLLSAEGRSR
jgi:hypothetical protein